MKRTNIQLLITFVVISGAMWMFRSPLDQAQPPTDSTNAATENPRLSASVKAASTTPQGLVEKSPREPEPAAFSEELRHYVLLKKKVFLTTVEQAAKHQLLNNRAILSAMLFRLKNSPTNHAAAVAQNAALDLLLEALRYGDTQTASDVLQGVVQDPQIEDTTLDPAKRQNLAGIKAEVLYQWSAINPGLSETMAGWLPGPVSKKIWLNVLKLQKSNLAESAFSER